MLALEGDLGAGKTTFARGLLRGLGVAGDVTSPSFALLNVHQGDRQVFHVDAYRLTRPEGFDDLLIWDLATSPWNVLVEWPERLGPLTPPEALCIRLTQGAAEDARHVVLSGWDARLGAFKP